MKTLFKILFLLLPFIAGAQTHPYTPSENTGLNKPPAVINSPLDARSYYYDAAHFVRRPYQSLTEVRATLTTTASRVGQFPIIVNTTGTIGTDWKLTGGVNSVYWFRNCTDDTCLVLNSATVQPGFGMRVVGETASVDSNVVALKTDTLPYNVSSQDFSVSNVGTLELKTPYTVLPNVILLRTLPNSTRAYAATQVFRTYENKSVSDFLADTLDTTTPDDGVMVLVHTTTGVRWKRYINMFVDVRWFGAIGNNIHDDTQAFQNCWNWIVNTGIRYVYYIPSGTFKITQTLLFEGTSNNQFPRILGSSKGIGSGASTLMWQGAGGDTLLTIRHMIYSSIENVEFSGFNGSYAGEPSCLIYFAYAYAGNYSTTNKIINCSFGNVGGDSSACVKVNVGGPWQNYQVDELTFDHCIFSGNGLLAPLLSWHAVWLGRANTKNFFFRGCNMTGFSEAAINAGYCGPIHSQENLISTCGYAFHLDNETTLVSENDYSESCGQILGGPGGTSMGSFTFIGYEDHSANWAGTVGYNPAYPTTNPYRIEGKGPLTLIGCTFNQGDSVSKIHWDMESDASGLVAINNNFTLAREGRSPFYTSSGPWEIGTQDRHESVQMYNEYHLTSINNWGVTPGGGITWKLPNLQSEPNLLMGLTRIKPVFGKPTTGRWFVGDRVLNLADVTRGIGGDGRPIIKEWVCTRMGMFKTVSITGTSRAGSAWIRSLSSTATILKGDIVSLSGGNGSLGFSNYTYEIAEVRGDSLRISGFSFAASSSTTVTITNQSPVFSAVGSAFGTLAERDALNSTLTVNDRNYMFQVTTDSSQWIWRGGSWLQLGAPSGITTIGNIGNPFQSLWKIVGSNIYGRTMQPNGPLSFSTLPSPNDSTIIFSVTISAPDQNLKYNSANGQITTNSAFITLTDGATITWDATLGFNAKVTLGGNRALAITNPQNGQVYTLQVTQDGTGSRTLSLPSGSKVFNGGAGVISLSTAGGSLDEISCVYNGTNFVWTAAKNAN